MKDVICGMDASESSKFKSAYKGKTYNFCSKACKDTFDKKPGKYAKG